MVEGWGSGGGSLIILLAFTTNGVGTQLADACHSQHVDSAGGVGTCRNRHHGGVCVPQQCRADEHTHPVVVRRDSEVHHVDEVVGAAVVVGAGGSVVGVRGDAAIDNEEVAYGRGDSRGAITRTR